jgi:hypothetical protein
LIGHGVILADTETIMRAPGRERRPIPARDLTRDPIYALGPTASPLAGVRLEASFPRAEIERAAAPALVMVDDKTAVLWQRRIDLSR